MLFANVCAGFFFFWYGVGGEREFWGFLAPPSCLLVHMEVASLASLPLCVQGVGHKGVPPAGHALWAEVGGGMIFVTSVWIAGQHIKLPVIFVMVEVIPLFGSRIC